MKLLHLDASVLNENSASRVLTAEIVQKLRAKHADLQVTYRDLAADAPAHLSAEILGTRFAPADQWNPLQTAEAALTETLLEEFLGADIVVIGAPMYNFSIPTQLKAWIDRIAQVGRTFRYGENGPVGLAGGKKVIIGSSRGGAYSTSEQMRAMDFQEDYLKVVLGFVGVTDVTIVRAEGLAMGPEARSKSMGDAHQQIGQLLLAA
ncbi:MAG: NAD(P)H-dependent oxidoreductase [Burkholderiaceae bacterium]|nr:NAD(P)H-dependent oxidoreductase [Burkholderiaceae bacterium]